MYIGPYQLSNNLIVAPMAGVTDRPFRTLCKYFGAGHAVSEMMTSDQTLRMSKKSLYRANFDGELAPISAQIAGSEPNELAEAARYQVANGYMGRVGLINSGGESHGESDLHDAVVTAVVNKRAGGMGLISGRKAFQKPMKDGVQLLNTIQDVYLDSSITIA